MAVKVYFNNQIHRFAKLPENLQALFAHVTSLFKGELPATWVLQYVDSDGDHIIVSHEHDFKELVELESANPTNTIKLHIFPIEEGVSMASVETAHKEPVKNSNFVDYEVISQNNEEKTASADSQQQLITEAEEPQVTFKPSKKECKNKFKHAKHLGKRLWKGKCDDSEKNQIVDELNQIRETLTEEQKEELDKKRAKVEAKFARLGQRGGHHHHRGGHHGPRGHHHGPHGHHRSPHHQEEGHQGPHGEGPHGHRGHHGPHGHHRHHGHHGPHHHRHFPPGFGPFQEMRETSEGRKSSCDKKKWHMKFAEGFKGGFGGFGGFFKGFRGFGGGFGKGKCHEDRGMVFFKCMKLFKKYYKAQKEGNAEKAAEKKAKLFEMVPEDAKPLVEAILESLPQDLDKHALKERMMEGTKKFLETCFPEGKEKILEEFDKMTEKRKEKREKFRAMWEEKKKMFGENWHQQKAEMKEKYSEEVFRKAMKMKMIFTEDEIAVLCEYVSIYWKILVARLAFLVVFQNIVGMIQTIVAWAIPDTPLKLNDQIKREKLLIHETLMEEEKKKIVELASKVAANGGTNLSNQTQPEIVHEYNVNPDGEIIRRRVYGRSPEDDSILYPLQEDRTSAV